MKKTFSVSKKGRIYERGLHVTAQDIATIHFHHQQGYSELEIAKILKMDPRTVKKYSTSSEIIVGGRPKWTKYHEDLKQYLEETIQQNPTIYLDEIQEKLDVDLNFKRSISQIHKYLANLNFTRKKVNKIAYYRSTQRIQTLREKFRNAIKEFHPNSFIFIDESSFDFKIMSRNYGYGKQGNDVHAFEDKVESKRYSIIAAISSFGIHYYEIIDTTTTSVDGNRFYQFLQQLIPRIPINDCWLYLDNARIHKIRKVFGLFEEFNVNYFFSSPYSPDYNAIEFMFGYIKGAVKRYQHYQVVQAIKQVLKDLESRPELFRVWVDYAATNWQSNSL